MYLFKYFQRKENVQDPEGTLSLSISSLFSEKLNKPEISFMVDGQWLFHSSSQQLHTYCFRYPVPFRIEVLLQLSHPKDFCRCDNNSHSWFFHRLPSIMQRGFLSKNNEAALVTEFAKQTVPCAKKIRREKFLSVALRRRKYFNTNFFTWKFSTMIFFQTTV